MMLIYLGAVLVFDTSVCVHVCNVCIYVCMHIYVYLYLGAILVFDAGPCTILGKHSTVISILSALFTSYVKTGFRSVA